MRKRKEVLLLLLLLCCSKSLHGFGTDFRHLFVNYGFLSNPYEEEYDFVVIGAGAAGSVVASRLSEHPGWSVLLLEAGDDPQPASSVPFAAPLMQLTKWNWGHTTEPQAGECQGMVEGRCSWPRGRALGGTTAINYMVYSRGSRHDYDRWRDTGCPGFGWDDVLPYFRKSEDASRVAFRDAAAHGLGGPAVISDVPYRSEAAKSFVEAGQRLGYQREDYNRGEQQAGINYVQTYTEAGRRESIYDAFVRPVLRLRANLRVRTRAFVARLLLDREPMRARGVEYWRDGALKRVWARKEIILSAGVIGSAKILMLSGIGPRLHLRDVGVEAVLDLPVGEFLQDHSTFPGLVFRTNTSIGIPTDAMLSVGDAKSWFFEGRGPLASVGVVEVSAFHRTQVPRPDLHPGMPDTELILFGSSIAAQPQEVPKRVLRLRDDVYAAYETAAGPTFSVLPMLLQPRSVGYMRLRSASEFEMPRLFGNDFTDAEGADIRTMVQGIQEALRIVAAEEFQRYGAVLHAEPIPACKYKEFASDEYWECAVRQVATTNHHQCGTCRMGPEEDRRAVVNPQFQVKGMGCLRVVDSSVFPFAGGWHPVATTVMLAEKAADIIKTQWWQTYF